MEEERLAGGHTGNEQRDLEFLGDEHGPGKEIASFIVRHNETLDVFLLCTCMPLWSVLEEPATDDAHMWGMPLLAGTTQADSQYLHNQHQRHHHHHHQIDDPPPFNVATSQDFAKGSRRSSSAYTGMDDRLDMENLKSSLSEFEQHKKVEAARLRRESHLQKKVCQVSMRNTTTAQKTFEVLQQQWVEDNTRDEYASLLRRKHSEHVMLRKVQKGILRHMRDGQLDQSQEARERIQEIKKEARWHFQSLQNLFDDRVKSLRSQEMDLRVSQEEDVGSYKHLHDQLRQLNILKQKKTLQDNKEMLQQKRLYSSQMRQDTHQQLLSYLAAGDAWEDSLRASWPPPPASVGITFRAANTSATRHSIPARHVHSPKGKTHINKTKKNARPRSAPLMKQRKPVHHSR